MNRPAAPAGNSRRSKSGRCIVLLLGVVIVSSAGVLWHFSHSSTASFASAKRSSVTVLTNFTKGRPRGERFSNAAREQPVHDNSLSERHATVEAIAVPPARETQALIPLEKLLTTVALYRGVFGGNPVGVNREITRALNGSNPRRIKFLDSQALRIGSGGELLDPWGTPYFFHQLSGKEMEIRSAGPDRKLWTPDDVLVR